MLEEQLPLEEVAAPQPMAADRRPLMPEPPAVRLLVVADVHRPTAPDAEARLDRFYTELLPLVREPGDVPRYRAERFAVVFDLVDPPVTRDAYQPLGIELYDLAPVEQALLELGYDFERVTGLVPGADALLLQDPAGNWVALTEYREVR